MISNVIIQVWLTMLITNSSKQTPLLASNVPKPSRQNKQYSKHHP